MKRIEATSYDPATKVAIWDLTGISGSLNLAIALNLEERTARFFISGITDTILCDVEISPREFKSIFPTRALPGMRGYLDLTNCWFSGGTMSSKGIINGVMLEEVLEGHFWSFNTFNNYRLEGSLGPAPTSPKDPRIGAEVIFDGTWGVIEEIWPPNSRRDYEAFWVRDEDGGEHELTESRVEFTSSITS